MLGLSCTNSVRHGLLHWKCSWPWKSLLTNILPMRWASGQPFWSPSFASWEYPTMWWIPRKTDTRKQLWQRDISVGRDCLLVDITWSKTLQFGQNSGQIPVLAIPESKLCPVFIYRHMTQMVKTGPQDPALCLPGKQGPSQGCKVQTCVG